MFETFADGPESVKRTALFILLLFCGLLPQIAHAQSAIGPGVDLIASGTIDTGVLLPPNGYALYAASGGTITGTDPLLTVTTGGGSTTQFGGSHAVFAQSGGEINLSGGGVITTIGENASAVLADGSGTGIFLTGMKIETYGDGAYGAAAANFGSGGGTVTIHGGTIDTYGEPGTSYGLYSDGTGTNITADSGLQVVSTGDGAYATNGGVIALDTVSIVQRTSGDTLGVVTGLRADSDSSITANNVDVYMIDRTAEFEYAVLASAGGVVTLTNSRFITSGIADAVLHASQANTVTGEVAVINADNVTAVSLMDYGHGAYAYNGATINLNTATISTAGTEAYGINVDGYLNNGVTPNVTQVVGDNVTVNTTGEGSWGAVAMDVGTLTLNNSSLTAQGTRAGGVFVSEAGSTATLRNSIVTSEQWDGGEVSGSGQLFITNTTTSGYQHGISSYDGTVADPNIAVIDGGSLTAATGDLVHAQDTIAQLTLRSNSVVSAGSGNLLNVISTDPTTMMSNVAFNIQNIVAAGDIIADAASTANVNITSGSTITGIQRNTFTIVDSSSTWIMNGNSDIHSLTLAGLARFTAPAGDPTLLANYKTLTTQNYIGQGGSIGFNTYLSGDGAASDRLVINGGTATGSTFVRINNTGGPGALTTGDGILLV